MYFAVPQNTVRKRKDRPPCTDPTREAMIDRHRLVPASSLKDMNESRTRLERGTSAIGIGSGQADAQPASVLVTFLSDFVSKDRRRTGA